MHRAVKGLIAAAWLVACTDARLVAQAEGGAAAGGDGDASGGEAAAGGAPSGGAAGRPTGGHSPGGGRTAEGTAGAAGTQTTPVGGTACTGELDAVRRADGLDCPDTYCGAAAWASSCDSFETPPVARYIGLSDQGFFFVEIDWGNATKVCGYTLASTGSGYVLDPYLVAAAATSSTPSYCDGASTRIAFGIDLERSIRDDDGTSIPFWSDYGSCPEGNGGAGATGSAGAGGGPVAGSSATAGVDAAAGQGAAAGSRGLAMPSGDTGICMNRWWSEHGGGSEGPVCEPCCPDPLPECPAEGYEDYACTSMENPWCECTCANGDWSCGC